MYFPYDYIYPEQYLYMVELKRSLDAKVTVLVLVVRCFLRLISENINMIKKKIELR